MSQAATSVVVTGASSGIGHACVRAFADLGAHVVGVDIEGSSDAALHISLDLAQPDCGETLVEVLGDLRVDILVNNAAIAHYTTALDTEVDIFDRALAVNLRAPFLLAKALYPKLRASRGAVVNVASVHAVATSPGVVAYAAAKGGLVSLTRALALEWAPQVRVNAVLPGAVDTVMLTDGLHRSGMTTEELGSRHPMARVGDPAEIAEAVVFLAGSSFSTGSSLVVDGGATARLSTE